jgi:hypothetical protein
MSCLVRQVLSRAELGRLGNLFEGLLEVVWATN